MLDRAHVKYVNDLVPILKGSHSLYSHSMQTNKDSIYLFRKGSKLNKYLFVFMMLCAMLSGFLGGAGQWGFFIVSGVFTSACFVSLHWLRKMSREGVYIDLKKGLVNTCSVMNIPFSGIDNLEMIEKRAHSEEGYFQLVCELNIALNGGGRVNLAVGEINQMESVAELISSHIDCYVAYKKL